MREYLTGLYDRFIKKEMSGKDFLAALFVMAAVIISVGGEIVCAMWLVTILGCAVFSDLRAIFLLLPCSILASAFALVLIYFKGVIK